MENFMAGLKPSFITGASAKIKIGTKTLAYAQDVNYSVTVTTIPIETMGRYEVVSNEPVAYFVDGSFAVVRYTAAAGAGADHSSTMQGTTALGNDMSQWSAGFDPSAMLSTGTFDLEIFQKTNSMTTLVAAVGTTPAILPMQTTISVMKLIDCRLTRMGGAINKRGILVEQFSFNAIMAESGGVPVSHSGDKDLAA